MVSDERVTAEGLARSEIKYIKDSAYQSSYLIDPNLSIPDGWSINATAEAKDTSDEVVAIIRAGVWKDSLLEISCWQVIP